jgi:hypothetical protein
LKPVAHELSEEVVGHLLDRFSIVHTGSAISVRIKERINRTRITPTGADHHR